MKKSLFIGFIAILVLSAMMPAFGGTKPEAEAAASKAVKPAGVYPIVDEKITISAYFGDNTSWLDMSENNRALKFYEEKTNIRLDIVFGDRKVLFASGNYPEIFFSAGLSNQDIIAYAEQGLIVPLNDLIDKYGLVLKRAQGEGYPHLFEDITAPDGKIYGVPTIGGEYHAQTQKAYVNVTWLDKLGLKQPETIDDFANMLRAFKKMDPDVIPYTGCIETWWGDSQYFLMNPFIPADFQNAFLVVDGKKVEMAAIRPEWKAGLKWANSLYKEGLIDPGAFTQKIDQLQMLVNNEAKPLVGVYTSGHLAMGVDTTDIEFSKQWDSLTPPKGPNGEGYVNWWDNTRVAGAQFVMTDNCKNPDAAFRYLNFWMTGEAFFWNWIGDAGIRYIDAKPGQLNMFGKQAEIWDRRWETDYKNPIEEKLDAGRLVQNPQMPQLYWQQAHAVSEDIFSSHWWTYANVRLAKMTEKYEDMRSNMNLPKGIGSLWVDADTATEISQIRVALTDYIIEHMVRFITGNLDVDSDWDTYVRGVQNLQLAKFLDMLNGEYGKILN